MKKKFLKTIDNVGLEALTPEWRYRYRVACMYLGDFSDYWGWENRGMAEDEGDGWASEIFFKEAWLPKWGGGYVDRLLVLGEQGIGDMVFYASILPECMIRVKQVVYECDERLHKLLERSLPGLKCDIEHPFEQRRDGDAFIPAAELMRMFRREVSHFPGKRYLRSDPERNFEVYRGRTGIAWFGRQGSIDPAKFGIENPINLQYDKTWEGAENTPIDLKNDIDGIVTLCSVLDRVVTVPQSVMHFAGGIGCKVDVVLPEIAGEAENQIHWDYPVGTYKEDKLPWYPEVKIHAHIPKSW